MIAMLPHPYPLHPPDGRRYESLSIDVRRLDPETMVVALSGEADVSTEPALREAMNEAAVSGSRCVIVDLDGLTFLDAVTLDWLAELRTRLSAAGATLQVSCRTSLGQRLLMATGLDFLLA